MSNSKLDPNRGEYSKNDNNYIPTSNAKTLHLSPTVSKSSLGASPQKDFSGLGRPSAASHMRSISSTSAGSHKQILGTAYNNNNNSKPTNIVNEENSRVLNQRNLNEMSFNHQNNRMRVSIAPFDQDMQEFQRKMNDDDIENSSFDKPFYQPMEYRLSSEDSKKLSVSNFRDDEEIIHLRVENERMKSELNFLKRKLEEKENEFQRTRAIQEKNLDLLAKTNQQLNLLLQQKTKEVDDLRLSKWKGLDQKEYEEYFKNRIEILENKVVQLSSELVDAREKYEILESEKIHIETIRGSSPLKSNQKWEKMLRDKDRELDEAKKKIWELERTDPKPSPKFLEVFLLLCIEVERLHAILKGRLEEIRILRLKVTNNNCEKAAITKI